VVIYFRKEGRALGEVTKVEYFQSGAELLPFDRFIVISPTKSNPHNPDPFVLPKAVS